MAHRRAQVSPPPEQFRCSDCRRYRLKGRACDHCDLQEPSRCTCDVLPLDVAHATIPDSHRHILHALLELIYKRAVEETDEWILQPASDVQPTPRPHWSQNPELAPHLAAHPILGALCRREGGVEAVYDWAGLRPREALAYDLHLVGWSDEVVAYRLALFDAKASGRLPLTPLVIPSAENVRQLYTHADERIRTTLTLVEGADRKLTSEKERK